MSSKSQVLALYKTMLRESQKFPAYNFREYAKRRIKDAFRDNKDLSDTQSIESQLKFAAENLQVIKRQVLIGDLYRVDKLVIEK